MKSNKKTIGRPTTSEATEIIELETFNLREYSTLAGIPYSTLSKKKTGDTLVAVKHPNRKSRYLHPEIAEVVTQHLATK